MERVMDNATKKLSRVIASIEARGCGDDEWARLMRTYALGLLSEDDRDYPNTSKDPKPVTPAAATHTDYDG
jgi:hypothetical protein